MGLERSRLREMGCHCQGQTHQTGLGLGLAQQCVCKIIWEDYDKTSAIGGMALIKYWHYNVVEIIYNNVVQFYPWFKFYFPLF